MASIRTSSASLLSCTDGANPPCVAGEVNQAFENLISHRVVSSYLPFVSQAFHSNSTCAFAKTQLCNTKTKIFDYAPHLQRCRHPWQENTRETFQDSQSGTLKTQTVETMWSKATTFADPNTFSIYKHSRKSKTIWLGGLSVDHSHRSFWHRLFQGSFHLESWIMVRHWGCKPGHTSSWCSSSRSGTPWKAQSSMSIYSLLPSFMPFPVLNIP